MDANMPGAVLVTTDNPRKVFDWYVARLKAAGWQLQAQEFDASAKSFALTAMKGSPEQQQIATLAGGVREGAAGSQFTVMLIGPSVSADTFKGIPTEQLSTEPEPDKPADTDPIPGMPTPEQIRRMERTMPKTPPNALQKGAGEYPASLEKFLKATIAWADNPTRANLMAALAAAPAFARAADGLRASSAAAMRGKVGASFAGVLWSRQVMTDVVVGMIITSLEAVRDKPALAATLRAPIREQARKLLDEDVKAFRAMGKQGDRLVERIKQKGPGPDELDTVLTNDHIRATPETIYIPRTDLRVRSMWTPLPSYWKQVLREAATALRAWNAGCPDGCTVDDDGVTHCKACGPCPN